MCFLVQITQCVCNLFCTGNCTPDVSGTNLIMVSFNHIHGVKVPTHVQRILVLMTVISFSSSQVLESVVDLHFQHTFLPFLMVSGSCVPVSCYHSIKVLFCLISLSLAWSTFFFCSFYFSCWNLVWYCFIGHAFHITIPSKLEGFYKFYNIFPL
jgi:hypothetical protein